jgi:hypothetical protein
MTTPYQALQPTVPRYIEIDYVAVAGGCCSFSGSSGSSNSYPTI